MNIAFVSEHASPLALLGGVDAGGQNVHVAALAEAMARQGCDVRVYTRRDDARLPVSVPFCSGVLVDHIDAGPPKAIEKDRLFAYMPAFADALRARWNEWRPDIVHAHFWMSGVASLDAAASLGVPVVQTFHALGIEKRRHQGAKDTSPDGRLEEEARIAREASHIVATSTAETFELVRMGADCNDVSVVPCGVDIAGFGPLGPAEPRDRRKHRIVCVSRLVERKGIADVISALALLPNTELIVAGGPHRDELWNDAEARRLREIARSLGVEARVDFRGRIDRRGIARLLRSADVVVSYPWYEPFGIVPLEAMACGVPVVVASVGGLVDSVVDGVTGLHVKPHAPVALAVALHTLLANERLRVKLGIAGAARARERYAWSRIASETQDVYRRVLAKRVAARAS